MLNIICVKWGDKYSSEYVNRLFKMSYINISIPFNFYCYTDNSKGIIDDVKIIKIKNNYLEGYWNKLSIFQKNFIKGEATNLYFDLDTVIQNNLNPLLHNISDDLTLVRCYWKGDIVTDGTSTIEKSRWDMYINSSIMLWKNNTHHNIWEHFDQDPEYYMLNYIGMDRFLFHEKFKFNFFPKGLIYSRMKGEEHANYTQAKLYDIKLFKDPKTRIRLNRFKEIYMYYMPEKLVCIFNGPTEEWTYEEFKHYWS